MRESIFIIIGWVREKAPAIVPKPKDSINPYNVAARGEFCEAFPGKTLSTFTIPTSAISDNVSIKTFIK